MAKNKVEMDHMHCMHHCSPKCWGAKLLVLGVLIGLNAQYGWLGWGLFVGGIVAIKGLVMLLMPKCPVCKC